MCDEHTRDLFALDEGDEATLVLDDGSELDVTVTDKTKHHSDDRNPTIWEQTSVSFETDDGVSMLAIIVDGLGSDNFPSHSQLQDERVLDPYTEPSPEHLHGYVTEVRS
jgi:hypothetical protein